MRMVPKETSGSKGEGIDFEEVSFGVGDLSVILGVLRHKMYSNPIRIVCQEIMSNARDAHREVGKHDVPIQVSLPTEKDPFLCVRDFGPGISPERMKSVYIFYGSSTKRSDDEQTGGFGLGAKTPWAYGNVFEVDTVTPEYDVLCRRHYRAYIDESRIGKIALKEYEKTDELQGTTIIIPVEPKDFTAFWNAVKITANFWKIHPTILVNGIADSEENGWVRWGDWFDYKAKTSFEGTNWRLLTSDNLQYSDRHPIAIIDEIPYDINLASLKIGDGQQNESPEHDRVSRLREVPVCLYFDTGEVDLAANREALDYNDATIEEVLFRFTNFLKDMDKTFSDQITSATNLWDANVAYSKLREQAGGVIDRLGIEVTWKGLDLHSSTITVDSEGHDFRLYAIKYLPPGPPLFESEKINRLDVRFDATICIDDTGGERPSRSRLLTIMKDKSAQGFCVAYVFQIRTPDIERVVTYLNTEYHLDQMGAVCLSTIQPSRLPRKKTVRTPRGERVVQGDALEYSTNAGGSFFANNIKVDLTGGSGYYLFKHYSNLYLDKYQRKSFDIYNLQKLIKKWQIKVVAFRCNLPGNIGKGWTSFEDKMKNEYNLLSQNAQLVSDRNEFIALQQDSGLPFDITRFNLCDLVRAALGSNHIICQYADMVKRIESQKSAVAFLQELGGILGIDDKPSSSHAQPMGKEILTKYPLLLILQLREYDRRAYPHLDDKLLAYIRAVDAGHIL